MAGMIDQGDRLQDRPGRSGEVLRAGSDDSPSWVQSESAVSPPLAWTKDPPTREGWYWHRWNMTQNPKVVCVVRDYGLYLPGTTTPEEFMSVWLDSPGMWGPELRRHRITADNGYLWAGPIEPPA